MRSCDFDQTKAYVYYQARRYKKQECPSGFKITTEDGEIRYHNIGYKGSQLSSIREHLSDDEINFLGETLKVNTIIELILSIAEVEVEAKEEESGYLGLSDTDACLKKRHTF